MEYVGAAIVGAVAAPLVIPAAVTFLGFGAAGIAAGSTAATVMSWGGGVTPAAVSVCQSIGATGAISATTKVLGAVLAGAGAVLFAKVFGG